MRRYRNARYAPESLERKLSPSSMGMSPAPAMLITMSAPGPDMTVSPPLYAGYGSFSDGSATSANYIPTVAMANVTSPSPTLFYGDTLLADGDSPAPPTPYPGEGPGPLGPLPNPVGPVVPA